MTCTKLISLLHSSVTSSSLKPLCLHNITKIQSNILCVTQWLLQPRAITPLLLDLFERHILFNYIWLCPRQAGFWCHTTFFMHSHLTLDINTESVSSPWDPHRCNWVKKKTCLNPHFLIIVTKIHKNMYHVIMFTILFPSAFQSY